MYSLNTAVSRVEMKPRFGAKLILPCSSCCGGIGWKIEKKDFEAGVAESFFTGAVFTNSPIVADFVVSTVAFVSAAATSALVVSVLDQAP
jgi:hypothetical protein